MSTHIACLRCGNPLVATHLSEACSECGLPTETSGRASFFVMANGAALRSHARTTVVAAATALIAALLGGVEMTHLVGRGQFATAAGIASIVHFLVWVRAMSLWGKPRDVELTPGEADRSFSSLVSAHVVLVVVSPCILPIVALGLATSVRNSSGSGAWVGAVITAIVIAVIYLMRVIAQLRMAKGMKRIAVGLFAPDAAARLTVAVGAGWGGLFLTLLGVVLSASASEELIVASISMVVLAELVYWIAITLASTALARHLRAYLEVIGER